MSTEAADSEGQYYKAGQFRLTNTNAAQTRVTRNACTALLITSMIIFAEKLTLKQLAEKEYLSESHLSKYIKGTLGLTFHSCFLWLAVRRRQDF